MPTSTKWGIRYPAGTDAPDVPLWMSRMAADLDDVAKDSQGSFASRPTSSAGTPGKSGRYYTATDLSGSPTLRDFGTGWRAVSEAFGTYANRPTASTDLEGLLYTATDKAMQWICTSAAWVLIQVWAPRVTALPTSPVDMQECLYVADQTNGIVWHLRYRALQNDGVTANPSTYKWEFVGGNELYAAQDSSGTIGSLGTYVVPSTAGPSLTVPLAGDYILRQTFLSTVDSADSQTLMSPNFGSGAIDSNAAIAMHSARTDGGLTLTSLTAVHFMVVTGLTAGQTITANYKRIVASASSVSNRRFYLLPRRVA